jgi:hypothetical protein
MNATEGLRSYLSASLNRNLRGQIMVAPKLWAADGYLLSETQYVVRQLPETCTDRIVNRGERHTGNS